MTNHQPADGVGDTVGGRNSAPVDMANNPLFTGFYTSQVVQVFFHQQYHLAILVVVGKLEINHHLKKSIYIHQFTASS